jgi:hypothetical protein
VHARRLGPWTLEQWEKTWPYKDFHSSYGRTRREAVPYHRDRLFWRLVVELFDRLRAGDLAAEGHRSDVPGYPRQSVPPGLWRNPNMVLLPHAPGGGLLRPEPRQGGQSPPGLPWYCELTLWPAWP